MDRTARIAATLAAAAGLAVGAGALTGLAAGEQSSVAPAPTASATADPRAAYVAQMQTRGDRLERRVAEARDRMDRDAQQQLAAPVVGAARAGEFDDDGDDAYDDDTDPDSGTDSVSRTGTNTGTNTGADTGTHTRTRTGHGGGDD